MQRQEEFKKLGLGLFIHYGPYSKFGFGEWYWNMYRLSEKEYYEQVGKNWQLKANFNNIAHWAKKNDFAYLVLTAKHHDGFALYDAKGLSHYDINWLHEKKDIIKDYITACQKYDLKPFIYYATMEWTTGNNDFVAHLQNIYDNIALLLQEYGNKIAGFWFDGNWSKPNDDWKLDELYAMIRRYNPHAIIVNNTGLENKGVLIHQEIDVVTYEQGMADNKVNSNSLPFEATYSLNDHWGPAPFDFNYKSVTHLIKDLTNIRCRGGNLLLNVGLDNDGNIDTLSKATIEKLHQWSKATDYWWKQPRSDFLISNEYLKYNDYLILTNVQSGAHIDNIHFGNQEGEIIAVPLPNNEIKITKLFYLDNKEKINFWIETRENNNILCFNRKSFPYGYNNIYRFIKIEKGS